MVKLKHVIVVALLSGLVGGLLGGLMATPALPPKARFRELDVDRIRASTILFDELTSENEAGVIVAQSKDGKFVTDHIVANRVEAAEELRAERSLVSQQQCQRAVTGSLVLAANPLTDRFQDCKIYGELSYTTAGARLFLLNREALFVPTQGELNKGQAIFFDFLADGTPAMYVHAIEAGEAGKRYLLVANPNAPKPTAKPDLDAPELGDMPKPPPVQ